MSKVIITLEDVTGEKGLDIAVSVQTDPPPEQIEADGLTPAAYLAVEMLEHARKLTTDKPVDVEIIDEAPKGGEGANNG